MKTLTIPISELEGLDFTDILKRFDVLSDDQAYDSEIGGDSDADDILPSNVTSPEPVAKRLKRYINTINMNYIFTDILFCFFDAM